MPPLRLYVETSVWSFWYADDAPERRDATREFFRLCDEHNPILFISPAVNDEISECPGAKRQLLADLIAKYEPEILEVSEEADALAQAYVQHGAIPPQKFLDAVHAAVATINHMDYLLSWNYRHFLKANPRRKIAAVSLIMGYPSGMEIITPMEVFEDEVQ